MSFVDSFQFWQKNIDQQQQRNTIKYHRNYNQNKHKNQILKKKKKKITKRNSEISPPRKIIDEHQTLLQDINRRATINQPPASLLKFQKPIITV